MVGAVIAVEIVEPGPRADELLMAMGETLAAKPRRKQDRAAFFWFGSVSPQAAWEAAVDAVNAAGADWADHLHLRLPPELNDRPRNPAPVLRCSFCAKPEPIVEKLIAGPAVYICDECVAHCVEVLEGGRAQRIPEPRADD